MLIGVCLVGIGSLLETVAEDTISGAESDVAEGFSRLPDRVEEAVIGAAQLGAMLVPLFGIVVLLWRRRWRLMLQLWLASSIASVAAAVNRVGSSSS